MSPTASDIVRSFYDATGGDFASLRPYLADEVDWNVPGSPSVLPWAGPRTTPEEIDQAIRSFLSTCDFEPIGDQKVVADGDEIFVVMRVRAIIKKNGRVIEDQMVDHFTVKDGRIVAFREYYDTSKFEAAYQA